MKISKRDRESTYFSSGEKGSVLWNRYFCLIIVISCAINFGNFFVGSAFSYWVIDWGGTSGTFGLIHGLYSLLIMCARPITGWLADHGDRRTTFIMSVIVYVSSMILMLISPFFALFVALRLIQGIGIGGATTIVTTSSYDYIPSSKLDKGIGYISLFSSIITALTPAMSIATYNRSGPFTLVFGAAIAAAIGVLLSFLIVFRIPKEPKEFKIREVFDFKVLFEKRSLKPALVMAFSVNLCMGVNTFVVLYGRSLGFPNPGLFSTVSACVLIFVRLVLDRIKSDGTFPRKRIYYAYVTLAAYILCLVFCKNLVMFFVAAFFWANTFGILLPTFTSMIIKAAPVKRRGAAASTAGVASDIGMILGSTVGGFIADALGYPVMYLIVLIPAAACCVYYRFFIAGKFKAWEETDEAKSERNQ